MSPEKHREIASKGGKASHKLGVGHEWNRESAKIAGAKGGKASRGGKGKSAPSEQPQNADSGTDAQ